MTAVTTRYFSPVLYEGLKNFPCCLPCVRQSTRWYWNKVLDPDTEEHSRFEFINSFPFGYLCIYAQDCSIFPRTHAYFSHEHLVTKLDLIVVDIVAGHTPVAVLTWHPGPANNRIVDILYGTDRAHPLSGDLCRWRRKLQSEGLLFDPDFPLLQAPDS
jgi:hypothetical protein